MAERPGLWFNGKPLDETWYQSARALGGRASLPRHVKWFPGLVSVGVIGISASIVAVGVWWSLLTAPEAAERVGTVSAGAFGHWALHMLRLVAAWL